MCRRDLGKLYQDELLRHNRNPLNFRKIDNTELVATVNNPTCGDEVTIYIKHKDDVITDASFQAQACAICKSSASVLTEYVKNRRLTEMKELSKSFLQFVEDWRTSHIDASFHLFSALKEFPTRKNCLLLPWRALNKLLEPGAKRGN